MGVVKDIISKPLNSAEQNGNLKILIRSVEESMDMTGSGKTRNQHSRN